MSVSGSDSICSLTSTWSTAPSSSTPYEEPSLALASTQVPLAHRLPAPHAMPLSHSDPALTHQNSSLASLPRLKPSPSMSTIQKKAVQVQKSDVIYFLPHSRRRSNSLSKVQPSSSLQSNTIPLAERRRSETSRYLGTDDFKSAFANNLFKVKEREQGASEASPNLADAFVFKTTEVGCIKRSDSLCSHPELVSPPNLEDMFASNKVNHNDYDLEPDLVVSPFKNIISQKSPTFPDSINPPIEESPGKIESHFTKLSLSRLEEDLEAKGEVISLLANQLSNQVETNDKLLFELGSLRAAYARLQSSCVDYVDELEILKHRVLRGQLDEQAERAKQEAELKVRDLRHLLEESKKAINRLQLEMRHQGHRRSSQGSLVGLEITPQAGRDDRQTLGTRKRLSLLGLGSENHTEHMIINRSNQSIDNRPVYDKLEGHYRQESIGRIRTKTTPEVRFPSNFHVNSLAKPIRPPRSAARSNPASPAAEKTQRLPHLSSVNDLPVAISNPSEIPTSVTIEASDELESLKEKCARLEAQLSESEDSRMASQAALNSLRAFISSHSFGEIPSIKLPPLPTDVERSTNEATSGTENANRWAIPNILTRSLSSKGGWVASSTPTAKMNTSIAAPSLGGGLGGFGLLWGRGSPLNPIHQPATA
ncbi:hypothetical protein O181_004551 [Austropuccinia psidii MF-1]|uniref:Uncharacterized protein n=1 Tax=Austropuccinia psidii MF-1 TaxID=1389203 RepID=A0A9Q3BFS1_9BASI|nr:hypothetical protein [Austropuccinia psidii MF-1]